MKFKRVAATVCIAFAIICAPALAQVADIEEALLDFNGNQLDDDAFLDQAAEIVFN